LSDTLRYWKSRTRLTNCGRACPITSRSVRSRGKNASSILCSECLFFLTNLTACPKCGSQMPPTRPGYGSTDADLQRKRGRRYRDRAKRFRANAAKTKKLTDRPVLIQLAQLCEILADSIDAQLRADAPHNSNKALPRIVSTAVPAASTRR